MSIISVTVKIDRKIVGEIKKTDNGFQYFPKGQKTGGQVYNTLGEVYKSLESDE